MTTFTPNIAAIKPREEVDNSGPVKYDIEIEPVKLQIFMKELDRFEPLVKDHSMIIEAKRCLRAYFYRYVLGYIPVDDAPYFAWGSAYHVFRYVLEKEYGYGDAAPPSFDADKAQDALVKASNAGIQHWLQFGKDQEVGTKYEFMTRLRLAHSFRVAFKHWTREKELGRIKVIAIEQPFSLQMPDGRFRSGRADQIVQWNYRPWGRDFKTTTKDKEWYERSLEPNDQFTGYTWAETKMSGQLVQGQLVEVLFNKKETKNKTGGPDIWELTTARTPEQLLQWEKEHIVYNRIIDMCRELDTWPQQEVSCSWCPYHRVCLKTSEDDMVAQLKGKYRLQIWDNTKVGIHE